MTDVIPTSEYGLPPAPEREPFPGRGPRRPDIDPEVTSFYAEESAALDEGRYDDWLAMLTEPFVYQMPVPLLREDPMLPRHSERALLFEATKRIFAMKLGRIDRNHAWSDRPPASTRHFVGAVRVFELENPHLLRADANVLAVRSRGQESVTATAARHDVLVRDGGDLRLLRRRVLLDTEMLNYAQLSLIF